MIDIKEEKSLFIELRDKLLKIGRFRRYYASGDGSNTRLRFDIKYESQNFSGVWIFQVSYKDQDLVRLIIASLDYRDIDKYHSNNDRSEIDNFFDKLHSKYRGLEYADSRFCRESYIDTDNLNLVIKIIDDFIRGAEKINLQLKGKTATGRKRL